ncbi:hypothetical protein [Thiomicrorhabdus sp.]|uniref:hypothetical protein n=1 Tax=Thiomicrorhabdus sp. TaxID=2039724 RepID=UPI0029C64674|nr:hypothetical protein [Thiomicrorhabdus sp.]
MGLYQAVRKEGFFGEVNDLLLIGIAGFWLVKKSKCLRKITGFHAKKINNSKKSLQELYF